MRHGSAHAYIEHKCRCDECRSGASQRSRAVRRLKAYGRWEPKFVDATQTRTHVLDLIAKGWGPRKIADKSGLHLTTVRQLAYGRCPSEMSDSRMGRPKHITRILKVNAEKLLSVQYSVDASEGGTLVPAFGALRRAEALAAMGYSFSWQAQQVGIVPTNYYGMLQRDHIQASTWHKVDGLYQKFAWSKRVGSDHRDRASISRTLNRAKRLGFLTAYAWDNIDGASVPKKKEETK